MNHTTELQTALMRVHPRLWKELDRVDFIETQYPSEGVTRPNYFTVCYKNGVVEIFTYALFSRQRDTVCAAIKMSVELAEKEREKNGTK